MSNFLFLLLVYCSVLAKTKYKRWWIKSVTIKSIWKVPDETAITPPQKKGGGGVLLICVCTLFLNVLISVAAAAVILFLPQDFSRIFIKEAVLGAVSAVVLTAAAVIIIFFGSSFSCVWWLSKLPSHSFPWWMSFPVKKLIIYCLRDLATWYWQKYSFLWRLIFLRTGRNTQSWKTNL